MMSKDVLLVFIRNPVYGKVKTRLAATMGDEAAFRIYSALLNYTSLVAKSVASEKIICYSDYIEQEDQWSGYQKLLQTKGDLGEKMKHAFRHAFQSGYAKAVIIGSDCLEITPEIIGAAFDQLDSHDVVIGPANDGGYYLLGMKRLWEPLFENVQWSSSSVFSSTINAITELDLSYFLLPVLNDIDEENDLKRI
ncbi:glycosyltransferase [Segetibacter sp. 3557_3]|uniref:TIGR04282 family arsenosugar biosynthesis glycosyltransferase n=1 Tax=Segetibacter sp. 3557_3 TaxID=2547429 RepID=UPI0010584A25|nr:TIGR04282 family arsenosugar biosynthesis glycosyltransferase [Segetibacter sp. 3557_3]TDH21610.1 glycosyltransferase [Segetibacter sp. 3557_3]